MQYTLATHNKGKIAEMQHYLLHPTDTFIAAPYIPAPEETGLTFVENALIKARYVSERAQGPAIADDSGLVVPTLGGAPGLYSARFAGPMASDADNITHLLDLLSNITDRRAFFYCIIVLLQHPTDPTPIICEGRWEGTITHAPSGDHGFGYDPVFWVPRQQCTAAHLSITEKNHYSHRGQALQKLALALDALRASCPTNA